MRTYRRRDRHAEADSRISQFCERAYKHILGLTYFIQLVSKFPTFYTLQTLLVHLLFAKQLTISIWIKSPTHIFTPTQCSVLLRFCNQSGRTVNVTVHLLLNVNITLEQAMKAQMRNRGIASLFLEPHHSIGVVNTTPHLPYLRESQPVPIVQEVGWAPGSVWTGAEYLTPTGIRSLESPAHS
jgi:hypothetical protein